MNDAQLKLYSDALFHEYKAIRDEIVATTAQFYSILQFGSAALFTLAGAALLFWGKERLLVAVAFGVILPALAFVTIEMLLGQIARIRRAGQYCRLLEDKVQQMLAAVGNTPVGLPNAPIQWETWLNNGGEDRRYSWLYAFAVAFFAIVTLGSQIVYGICILRWPQVMASVLGLAEGEIEDWFITGAAVLPFIIEFAKTRKWLRHAADIASPQPLPFHFLREPPMMRRPRAVIGGMLRTSTGGGIVVTILLAVAIGWGLDARFSAVFGLVALSGAAASAIRQSLRGSALHERRWTFTSALANTGIAGAIALLGLYLPHAPMLATAAIGSLAAVASGKLAYDISVLSRSQSRSIIPWGIVPRGTTGGVSLVGTVAAIAASAAVAGLALALGCIDMRQAGVAFAAGLAGNAVDTFAAAVLEKRGIVTAHTVNLLCAATGAAIAAVLA